MSWRFRRSIKVIPGVRINLTTRGLSTTIGPRGATVSFGSQGIFANLGLPGTGLSRRERLGPATRRPEARSEYREYARQLREGERQAARAAATEEHRSHEERFTSLRNVLRDRVRTPYTWDLVWASRPFEHASFAEPQRTFSEATVASASAVAHPIWPWAMLTVTGLATTFLVSGQALLEPLAIPVDPPPWLGIAAILGLIVGGAGTWTQRGRRAAFRGRRVVDLEQEHRDAVERAREVFATSEKRREEEWKIAEQQRERLRTAPDREDLEVLAQVLEAELSNEQLPVPLVFEIEFESAKLVRVELALPDLDDVPAERTHLTKTGKVSLRPTARRDRVDLYEDLCSGLVLRVIYEVFRVISNAQQIELFGTADGIDPATGHQREFVALHLVTTREACDRLDFDQLDPSSALEGLGGAFSLRRSGQLEPLVGVEGLGA